MFEMYINDLRQIKNLAAGPRPKRPIGGPFTRGPLERLGGQRRSRAHQSSSEEDASALGSDQELQTATRPWLAAPRRTSLHAAGRPNEHRVESNICAPPVKTKDKGRRSIVATATISAVATTAAPASAATPNAAVASGAVEAAAAAAPASVPNSEVETCCSKAWRNGRAVLSYITGKDFSVMTTDDIPQCLKTKVFNQCVLPVMTYVTLRHVVSHYRPHLKAQSRSTSYGEGYARCFST
ncbi:hypothetical protein B5X24_HaOG214745 [Helicoverpa armigera]|nr:hypothetical protein B5X24_HaOG214745 [Helicoverpa armigera]